jgi:diguanylate cyclase (GGDEF)-like protein
MSRLAGAAHRWYLAGGILVTVGAAPLHPAARVWVYIAVAASVVVAVGAGIRRHRPVYAAPWWLLIAAIAMSLAANAGWAAAMTPSGEPRFPSAGDLCYAVTLVLLLSSVYRWVRPTGHLRVLADVGLVTLGASALLWTFVVAPLIFDSRFTGARLASYLFYVAVDLLILACTARVVAVSRVQTSAYRLMVTAAILLVSTDSVHYMSLVAGRSLETLTAVGWLGSYVLIGAAALHPSMARSTGTVPGKPSPASRRRVVAYLALVGVVSALTVTGIVAATPHVSGVRVVVLELLGTALAGLLVVRLWQLAVLLNRGTQIDALTGLGNRAQLQGALRRVSGADRLLVLLNLDGFGDVNDAFGHGAGDAVLTEIGRRIRATVPADATVVRLGADEFAVLAAAGRHGDGGALAQQLLDLVHQPLQIGALATRRFGASIGVVPLPADRPCTHALRDADLALRAARDGGGDQIRVFQPSMHAERLANLALVARMHDALAAGEFRLHYQPIVDLGTGAVAAAEALLRWTGPDGVPVPPGRFVPLAEQSGAITAIGDWVLATACADLATLWHRHRVPVTVNVSARQLRDPQFSTRVLDLLQRHDLPGAALVVEITETVLVTSVVDVGTVTMHLQKLRDHGVRIAIDDFGTGYSSLAYLRELPVDILKMDGSFTAAQIEDGGPRELAFIRCILELSRTLSLRTVAEAVETAAQAERLLTLGCDLAQGYHFARPGPVAQLYDLIEAPAVARDPQGTAPAGSVR